MATQLAVTSIPYAGKTGALATFAAAATLAGNWFYCKHPSRTFILLHNVNAAARNMTLIGQKTNPQTGVVTSPIYNIAIGVGVPQFLVAPVSDWLIDEGGKIHISYDAVADLLIGVYVVGTD